MNVLHLEHVTKRYRRGDRPAVADVSFAVEQGHLTALVGESGSGKTTLLRIIAGLEVPDEGRVLIDGQPVFDGRIHQPPEKRGVGLVFQNHALFPHLSVAGNIGFGLSGQKRAERRRVIARMLELVGLDGYEQRFPHELSGGERQRVALARALAPKPAIILLDEPFSNLDASLRHRVRDEVRAILLEAGATALFVTHDTKDALSVADQVVVLREGVVQQVGAPQEIYHAPGNRYVAAFFGACNFLPLSAFGALHQARARCLIGPRNGVSVAGQVGLWIRPEDIEMVPPEQALAHGGLEGEVRQVTFCGEYREVLVRGCLRDGVHTDIVVYRDHGGAVTPGQRVGLLPRLRPVKVHTVS